VAFVSDDAWLASGSGPAANIWLWHTASGAHWRTLTGHTATVTGLAALPDTNLLVSASADDTLRLWQISDGTVLWASPAGGHTNSVEALAFSSDGVTLASGSKDTTVALRTVSNGALLRTLKYDANRSVDGLAFDGSGEWLAMASSQQAPVRLWQARSGIHIRPMTNSHIGKAVAFAPDGQTLVGGSTNGWVKLWRASDGALLRSFSNHVGIVGAVAFSTDGKTIASGGADATINLWNVADGSLLLTLLGHSNAVRALAYSPDGSRLASASWDGTVKLWPVTNYTPPLNLTGHTGVVNGVAFSADGRTLISVSEDRTLRFWDALSGSLLKATDAEISPIRSVACAPVGRLFAYGRSDGAVVLARNPFAWPVARLGGVASPAGGPFQFRLFGDLDCTYRLQTSSNLVNWSDWLSMVCTNVSMPVPADPNSTNLPRRFYRAVTP
jgi:WD40 repeat protein